MPELAEACHTPTTPDADQHCLPWTHATSVDSCSQLPNSDTQPQQTPGQLVQYLPPPDLVPHTMNHPQCDPPRTLTETNKKNKIRNIKFPRRLRSPWSAFVTADFQIANGQQLLGPQSSLLLLPCRMRLLRSFELHFSTQPWSWLHPRLPACKNCTPSWRPTALRQMLLR